jgi:MFS superfamily sulfate permease-like transporter
VLSLFQLIRRASKPYVAFLGRIPGTRRFSDRGHHPDNELVPGVLIFRPESSLLYFNVDSVCDAVTERMRADSVRPRAVIMDLSNAPHVDLQSAHALALLADQLRAEGTRMQIVEAHAAVRDRLRREGLDERVGEINRFISVADVVDNLKQAA